MKSVTIFFRAAGLLALVFFASCTLRETLQDGGPNRGPEFKVRTIEEASLNGLDVLPLRVPADMDLPRRNQIIAGYVSKTLPLRIRLQLNAYNPGLEPLTLGGLEYIVFLDGRVLGKNRMITAIELPPSDSVRVPVAFEFNTYKYLGDDAMPALRNFALGFGDPRRQRITLQVHPLLRSAKGRLSQMGAVSAPLLASQPQR